MARVLLLALSAALLAVAIQGHKQHPNKGHEHQAPHKHRAARHLPHHQGPQGQQPHPQGGPLKHPQGIAPQGAPHHQPQHAPLLGHPQHLAHQAGLLQQPHGIVPQHNQPAHLGRAPRAAEEQKPEHAGKKAHQKAKKAKKHAKLAKLAKIAKHEKIAKAASH